MKAEKKVVDLIYIEPQKDEEIIIKEFRAKIDYWNQNLKSLLEQNFEKHYDSAAPDVLEIAAMRKFLNQFLAQRLNWIIEKVPDKATRLKYLQVLPPFAQAGDIKTLLIHFFQVTESPDKKGLVYLPRSESDKEVSVLWDIYKLRKTIESLTTIKKSLDNPNPFESRYSLEQRHHCLDSLKVVFQLMFQMCIRSEHMKTLYRTLSAKHMSPEELLSRREKKEYYVYPHVLEKFNYRNHFFFMYFYSGMKAKIGGKIKEYRYNYLDFEVIKQDFLIDWMHKRLENNDKKAEVYSRYSIGGKTMQQIVTESPEKEIELLKQLPMNLFNDLTAEINDKVTAELKSGVSSMSDNYGEVAITQKHFNRARNLAKASIDKLKNFVTSRKKPEPPPEPVVEKPKPKVEEEPPAPKPEVEKPTFQVNEVKKKQIDFPYFNKVVAQYKPKMALQRVKMGQTPYAQLKATVTKLFTSVSESALIGRRTPKQEVSLPYHIIETRGEEVTNHLLILGAETKAKGLGMGYSSKVGADTKDYTPYLVYCCDKEVEKYGAHVENRKARGVDFLEYDFNNQEVRKKAIEFYKMVTKQE